MSRGKRISVARFMLSQHRLPIETGRWWKMEREERLCPVCTNVGRTCGRKLCVCGSPSDRCIGSEKHYVYECCITSKSWMTCKAKIRRKTGTECDEDDVQTLLIGKCWSEFCQTAILFGEHRWKGQGRKTIINRRRRINRTERWLRGRNFRNFVRVS